MYNVTYLTDVETDLISLPIEILSEVVDYLEKYKTDPYKYSGKLYNQGDIKLDGYRKTYVADATYRIVFCIEDDIAKIVEVVAVGEREGKQVYKTAYNRINKP